MSYWISAAGVLSLVFVFYGLTRMGSVLVMPQWIGFLLIAGVALVGLRVDQSEGDYE